MSAELYLRRAFWRNFTYSRLSLHSADFSYRVLWAKFYRRLQSAFNRAACFVANFTAVHARFNRRSFIAKRLLETKPVTRYAALLVLVSEPQILNLTRAALCQISPKFYSPRCRIRSFIQSPRKLAQNPRDKFYAAFVRPRSKRAAFYRHRDGVF